MTSVAILGTTGYTALELLKILLRHPQAEVVAATTRQEGAPLVADVHPSLRGRTALRCEQLNADALAGRAQCAFCALPHVASMEVVPRLLARGLRVIDLSADYRLKDPAVYAEWYGHEHADPANLRRAVYGLPELYRQHIRSAQLVANPGCYPTSAILALAPLLKARLIEPRGICVDSKSGVSGAGRTPKLSTHFPECNEGLSPYNVGHHRHTPEIDQVLSDAAGRPVEVVFTPQLAPMDRGILTTAYARPARTTSTEELLAALEDFYRDEPFVRVVQEPPGTKQTMGTNYCDVSVRFVRGTVVAIAAEDNLVKGASGAAVQNFNLMYGYPETEGLL